MSVKVHLVRHGETDWNAEGRIQGQADSRLTERGREQARELRERLPWHSIRAVACSDSLRTRQTAEVLMEGRALDVRTEAGLREIALGPWEGQLWADVQIAEPESAGHFWQAADRFQLPGAEDFATLQKRGVDTLEALLAQHDEGDLLVVSHGAIIACILSHYEGRPLNQLWAAPRMTNCALSTVEFNASVPRILLFADQETW